MTLDLVCEECGGKRFTYPSVRSKSPIVCLACGHSLGSFHEMRDRMLRERQARETER